VGLGVTAAVLLRLLRRLAPPLSEAGPTP
jgi:hypothetical protein